MQHLTTLSLLLTSLSLTTCTTYPNASTSALAAATTTTYPPPSAASLAAFDLPGGNASLTLYIYADIDCTDVNSTYSTLLNAQPVSYNAPSPQPPFWGFQMTRNLTGSETLSFYSSSNSSRDACGEFLGAWNASDAGAGFCWPSGGATCWNLTQS